MLAGGTAAGAAGALAACGAADTAGGRPGLPAAPPARIEFVKEWAPGSPNMEALDALLAKLRQLAPNLTVELTQAPGGAVRSYEMVLTRLAAGNPPDVSETYIANSANLGAKKIAEPLQTLFKGARDWSANDYFDGAREAWTYKGDFNAAPFVTAPMAVAVNQEMFDRANLKLPAAGAAGWTWDTFTDYAVRLTQGSGDTKIYGANMPTANGYGTMNFFGGPLWSHGGDWADRAKGTVTFHRPEGVAALEMWVNVALKQQAAPTATPPAWQGLRGGPFAAGLAAMHFLGAPELSTLRRDATGFQWTTVQMPRKLKPGSHFYSTAVYVLRAAKAKAGAAEFVRLLSLPEHLVQWNSVTLGMVTRKSAAARKEWQEALRAEPRMVAFNESTGYMRAYPVIPGWNEASIGPEGIGQALLDAVQGKASPKAALEEGARRADAFLATQAR